MAKKIRTLGRQEIIDLPSFGLEDIEAKVDTGAYTSAINCSRVKVREINGQKELTFFLSGSKIHEKRARKFSTTDFKRKKIKSSNGQIEERFVIKTIAIIYGRKLRMEFSLSDRSKMKFPILLGRKLLTGRYIVDVSKKNLSYKEKIKNEDSRTL